MKVREILKDETCWTQGVFFADKDNEDPFTEEETYSLKMDEKAKSEKVCRYCIAGAMVLAYGYQTPLFINAKERLDKLIRAKRQGYIEFLSWQDHPKRTFEEVRQLLLEADV